MAKNTSTPEEKDGITGLAKKLGRLSADKRRAALEMSAALAGVSLRVSREFIESVPAAARVLSADDIRGWGEMGRRLAMGSAEIGAKFFARGVEGMKSIPVASRPLIFQICTRQLVLSSSVAIETFESIPEIARRIGDDRLLTDILRLAGEIAQRSAKHSAEFIQNTPPVVTALHSFAEKKAVVVEAVLQLTSQFATRTGGMTADLWASLPASLEKITAANAVVLMQNAGEFLEFGGSV